MISSRPDKITTMFAQSYRQFYYGTISSQGDDSWDCDGDGAGGSAGDGDDRGKDIRDGVEDSVGDGDGGGG